MSAFPWKRSLNTKDTKYTEAKQGKSLKPFSLVTFVPFVFKFFLAECGGA